MLPSTTCVRVSDSAWIHSPPSHTFNKHYSTDAHGLLSKMYVPMQFGQLYTFCLISVVYDHISFGTLTNIKPSGFVVGCGG